MKKYAIELTMTCLLLVSFFFLSRQAAEVSAGMKRQKNAPLVIAVDPGHGGGNERRGFGHERMAFNGICSGNLYKLVNCCKKTALLFCSIRDYSPGFLTIISILSRHL